MASTAYNYLDIYDGVPSGAAGVILNDNFSDISDLTIDSIRGLHTSNGTDSDHDIDITTGAATDSTNASVLVLSSAITKQIDSSWSVGTAAGGLDTGSVTTSTWYAIWLIKRSDTGVVDALFSTSFSSPTMPTNYDYKRRIWAVLTDGSSNITAYEQVDDNCNWQEVVTDLNDTTPPTSLTALTVQVPPIRCLWVGYGQAKSSSGSGVLNLAPGNHAGGFYLSSHTDMSTGVRVTAPMWTTSAGQVYYSGSKASGWSSFQIRTIHYTDPRGKAVE